MKQHDKYLAICLHTATIRSDNAQQWQKGFEEYLPSVNLEALNFPSAI
jgi:hypothetical protein